MRLGVARTVLALGWVALVASLPMAMDYGAASVWNPQPLISYSTWADIYWVSSLSIFGTFLLAPFFVGLAAGTLATVVPPLLTRPRLVWACRILTIGVCESWTIGVGHVVNHIFDWPTIGGVGIGFFFCGMGSLLIGLSALIRPVRAISEGKNGKQNTASGANPDSGTEGT